MSCLAYAAGRERTADRAVGVLTALDAPIRERYPDAGIRIADLQRLVDAAATRPSLHDALVELALDPPVSSSDLAGPPRLDDDYRRLDDPLGQGLEWPVVHLLQLVDGAVPSDMALPSRAGLEEGRAAVLRGGDPGAGPAVPVRTAADASSPDGQRLRHGYGQLTRFLDPAALAECDAVDATPPEPVLPKIGPLAATIDAALDSLFGRPEPGGPGRTPV